MDFTISHLNSCSNIGLAARIGDINLLEKLLSSSATLDTPDNRGWLPIHEAAFGNHSQFLNRLLERKDEFDINFRSHDGSTAILIAAQNGHYEACKVLLDNGADPNLGSLDDMRPLIEATRKNSIECVRLLIERGSNVNATYWNGWTALHEAAYHGRAEILKLILNNNGDVYARDNEGLSPVFVACQHGQKKCLRILLKFCSDPQSLVNVCTKDGASCIYIAAQEGYDECLNILLKYKADVNLLTEEGVHAIVPAVKRGFTRCINLMMPFINPKTNKSSEDPVFVATEEGQIEALKMLIENHFCINRTTEYYREFVVPVYSYLVPLFSKTFATPLCSATAKCRLEIVKILLDSGACATFLASKTVFSPFLLAVFRRRTPEILREFLSHDIDINAVSFNSLHQVPDALLIGLHPIFHGQLLLLLKCGLKPSFKHWCGCRRASSEGNLLAELKRILLPSEIRDTLNLLLHFESGVPNCCALWESTLVDDWSDFANFATCPQSLSHLSRLAVRNTMQSKTLFEENFVGILQLPKSLGEFLLYENLN